MSLQATKPALDEQEELRQHVEHFLVDAHELPSLSVTERIDIVERIATFMADALLPHADLERHVLYPQAAQLLHVPDESEDVADDRAAVRELLSCLVLADPSDPGKLQEVLYALYTLLSAHFWREEAMLMKLAAAPDEERVREVCAAASSS